MDLDSGWQAGGVYVESISVQSQVVLHPAVEYSCGRHAGVNAPVEKVCHEVIGTGYVQKANIT